MKTALKISILLNFILLAGLIFVRASHKESTPSFDTAVLPNREQATQITAISTPPSVDTARSEPFHWSQLESSDYKTYVKNLRRVGCPEATLRAIVMADVDPVYRERNDDLRQKLANYEQLSWEDKLKAYNSKQAWLAELQNLPTEKKSQIDNMLAATTGSTLSAPQATVAAYSSGPPSTRPSATDTAPPTLVNGHNTQPEPALPLVYHDVDLSALNLNEQQIQAVNDLRQTFVEEIGGPNQDPTDPDYLQRWLKAQTDVDNLTKGMLGVMAWETYQAAAWN